MTCRRLTYVRDWWAQPDQYDWVTGFLRLRQMQPTARLILAIAGASSAVVPLTELIARDGSVVTLVLSAMGAILAAGIAALWVAGWPTRRQSMIVMMAAAGVAGVWSLAQSNAGVAATAATTLAITGGYMAVFHSAKLVLMNFVLAMCVGMVAAIRIADTVNIPAAVAVFWVICFLNVVVPAAVRAIAQAMGTYATQSGEDFLTGLLNRRAFVDAIRAQFAARPTDHTYLRVLMVDLDNFKAINDTHGHAAGDDALVAVAEILKLHVPSSAAICRAGGEEFLIAHTAAEPHTTALAVRLCTLIAALPHAITASIGASATVLHDLNAPDIGELVAAAIATADDAMYQAKRCGGNRAHQN